MKRLTKCNTWCSGWHHVLSRWKLGVQFLKPTKNILFSYISATDKQGGAHMGDPQPCHQHGATQPRQQQWGPPVGPTLPRQQQWGPHG